MVVYASDGMFVSESLPEALKAEMINQGTWKENCPIPLNRLRLLKISYYDFQGGSQPDGEMVVLDAVVERVLLIFKKLYALKFPIAKIHPMEHYQGDDKSSMADNNSTCFCYREITGGGAISIHAYGLAIDINPHQNPYINSAAEVLPTEGIAYLNRTNLRPGMAESIVKIFQENGFSIWGGNWNTPIDWQHFQTSRAMAQLLAVMSAQDAHTFFEMYVQYPRLLNVIDPKDQRLSTLYQKNPYEFIKVLQEHPAILDMPVEQALEIIKEKV